VIDRIVARARARGWITFLDVQPGLAPLGPEVDRLMPWLAEPDVHLAIDPEFAMPEGQKPGGRIGTLDAATINPVLERIARLVDSLGLPPRWSSSTGSRARCSPTQRTSCAIPRCRS